MKCTIACLLVALIVLASSHAEITKLPPEERKALQDLSGFKEIHATNNLPPAIIVLCADDEGRLADPGQEWQVTDVIMNPSLPRKRLIWAAVNGNRYVVHYEMGGIGHSFHVLVAVFKQGDPKAVAKWRGVGNDPLNDFKAFQIALKDNQLDDRLDYSY
jgi:hypothetical protein